MHVLKHEVEHNICKPDITIYIAFIRKKKEFCDYVEQQELSRTTPFINISRLDNSAEGQQEPAEL
ncbi:hypothetical protein T4D_10351 [Trichinella pseudospiralis]|uniref:Uncharacterized protein n=1 Tax=Trichinella pseudospiralis TaxID=6337 RepID=A0A0V1FAV2_TRIPS|nr:hypothetical protein T4D_10351 [Trichinella pseudospiralis]